MKYFNLPFYALLFVCFSFNSAILAQQNAKIDSAFDAKIDSAWAELRSNMSDSLQKKYAGEFYDYFLEHGETKTGKKAIQNAFMMWGNTGSALQAEEALKQLEKDSEIWANIINSVANSYVRSDERDREEYKALLQKLKSELSHPKSRSAVLLRLAENNFRNKNFKLAKEQFSEVVQIKTDSFYVDKAEGYLYELENLNIGQPAPKFTGNTITGESFTLSNFQDKVVLMFFWATWCGPCKPEIPHIKNLHSKYSPKELRIVGISFDRDSTKMKKFVEKKSMDWSQIWQPKSWQSEMAEKYNVVGIPRTFIIDQKGIIAAKDVRGKELEQKVEETIR